MKNVDREDSELSSRPDSSPSGDGAVTTNSGNLKSAEQDKLEQVRYCALSSSCNVSSIKQHLNFSPQIRYLGYLRT